MILHDNLWAQEDASILEILKKYVLPDLAKVAKTLIHIKQCLNQTAPRSARHA
jgi:inhibitor of KinA sporulation pathway (predicted exonuclease)